MTCAHGCGPECDGIRPRISPALARDGLRTLDIEVVWTEAGDDERVRALVSHASLLLAKELLMQGVMQPVVLTRAPVPPNAHESRVGAPGRAATGADGHRDADGATEAVEAALDAYAESHDGGTSYGAALAVLDALRAAPPATEATALGWEAVERAPYEDCGPLCEHVAYDYRPSDDEGATT